MNNLNYRDEVENYIKELQGETPSTSYRVDPKNYAKLFQSEKMSYEQYFELSCGHGNLEVIGYLLSIFKEKSDKNKGELILDGINHSITYGKLEVLDYLRNDASVGEVLTKEQLRNENFLIVEKACSLNLLNFVDYIFKHPQVDGEAFEDYEENMNRLFLNTIYNGNEELIQYFIFEHDCKKTESIQKLLDDITGPEKRKIESLFELNETKKSLEKELNNNSINNIKKPKI